MSIWKRPFTLEGLNRLSANTLVAHLGICFTGFGSNYLRAEMPVDQRTIQPMGLLHGGASVSLAETIGSVASVLCTSPNESSGIVGIEINANHLRAARKGRVIATCRPAHIGRQIHVWNIEIHNTDRKLICVSRLTTKVLQHR